MREITINGVKVICDLTDSDDLIDIVFDDLPREIKQEINEINKKIKEQSTSLFKYIVIITNKAYK